MLHGAWGLNQPFDSEGAAGWTASVAERRVSTAGVTPGVESAERNRLMQPPRSFAEFWPHYVLAHRHPATRAFHFTGTLAAWTLLIAAIARRSGWLVLVAVLV